MLNRIVNFGDPRCSSVTATTTRPTRSRRTGARSIETVQPLLSNHFNLTVELPLKAIVRGHSYAIVPISWTNRKPPDVSKLKLQEMGSRYLFIVLYVFLEHHLAGGLSPCGFTIDAFAPARAGGPGVVSRRLVGVTTRENDTPDVVRIPVQPVTVRPHGDRAHGAPGEHPTPLRRRHCGERAAVGEVR